MAKHLYSIAYGAPVTAPLIKDDLSFEIESPLPASPIKKEDFSTLMDTYVSKTVSQLEKFLVETKRSKQKLDAIFNAAEKLGYKDLQILDRNSAALKIAKARRIKKIEFSFKAVRDSVSFKGSLLVKPATIHLNLFAEQGSWKDSWKPVLTIKYFKNLCVYDNYLVYLVNKQEISSTIHF